MVIFFCSLLHTVHNQIELPLFAVQSLSLLAQLQNLCLCSLSESSASASRFANLLQSEDLEATAFLEALGRCWCFHG